MQGEFDGFWGLCSLVNALRLLLPVRPLDHADSKALFRYGIRCLERRDHLIAGGFGMPLSLWHALADEMVSAASLPACLRGVTRGLLRVVC